MVWRKEMLQNGAGLLIYLFIAGIGYILTRSAIFWITVFFLFNDKDKSFYLLIASLGILIAILLSLSNFFGITLSIPFLIAPIEMKLYDICDDKQLRSLKLGVWFYYISGVITYILLNIRIIDA